jgi:hypothetical protein
MGYPDQEIFYTVNSSSRVENISWTPETVPGGQNPGGRKITMSPARKSWVTQRAPARAGYRRFGPLSILHTHTKTPYKTDFLWETLRALNRPCVARTVIEGEQLRRVEAEPRRTWAIE